MLIDKLIIEALEKGIIPEFIVRIAVRYNVALRLREEQKDSIETESQRLMDFIESCCCSPIAVVPEKANEQHYEVPSAFYEIALGKRRKYSSCYYKGVNDSLDQAEEQMLALTCERAGIVAGQSILELGCGWGSLTLYIAEHYPGTQITALSNSNSQREYITREAQKRGLSNITVLTADINDFIAPKRYDRIVSVEMFEHLRNHQELFKRIRSWLSDQGKLFVHIFCHRDYAYLYQTEGISNWLGKNFFSGGMMPSDDLFLRYAEHLAIEKHWRVSGKHYARTAEDWLENIKKNREQVLTVLASIYGAPLAKRWFNRWSIFFIACAELFGYDSGRQWYVSHYLFGARPVQPVKPLE